MEFDDILFVVNFKFILVVSVLVIVKYNCVEDCFESWVDLVGV